MSLIVDLPDDLERRLRESASRDGLAVEEYVLGLIERYAARPGKGRGVKASGLHPAQAPAITNDEFDQLLDDVVAGPERTHLPADFSRTDIYADHD